MPNKREPMIPPITDKSPEEALRDFMKVDPEKVKEAEKKEARKKERQKRPERG